LPEETALAMMDKRTPSMAEKRENSVLFSLRELKKIEEDRVKSEEDAIRQREEDERARVAAESRRQREEVERIRREAEDAERARQDAEEAQRRAEQLRLEEAERLARVEAQARLEEQRLRMEIDARAREASTRKAKILVSITAVAFVVVAVAGVFAYRTIQEREVAAAEAAKQERINKENERMLADMNKKIDTQLAEIAAIDQKNQHLLEELNKSKDAEERKRINEQLAANARAKAEADERLRQYKNDQAKKAVVVKCKNPNDPLCGIGP
jgi:hypothetical protein